jgi:hypothetical protein
MKLNSKLIQYKIIKLKKINDQSRKIIKGKGSHEGKKN